MLAKTGLLIVSNPKRIEKLLSSVQPKVKNTVYIQLLSALTEPLGPCHSEIFSSWPKFNKIISGIYSEVYARAAKYCRNLDVRVLISGLKRKDFQQISTHREIDLVVFDKVHSKVDIDRFLQTKIANKAKQCDVIVIETDDERDELEDSENDSGKTYKHTVLGGTFDRLHVAHKLLLSEALLRSSEKLTVGITEENMLHSKTLWELIEPTEKRMRDVKDFLTDICGELEIKVVPIQDPFGPTQHDKTMDAIIVSAETVKGGQKVNEVRQKNGLPPLDVIAVELIDEPYPGANEEAKISSSTTRMRLLGTLLRPVVKNESIPKRPYVIGLTGAIASGKSGVAERLGTLNAQIIDCDKIGHSVYRRGKPCYDKLVEVYGNKIIGEDGEINRKALGALVFSNPQELEKLNSLVWPAIADEVNEIIRNSTSQIVVVEAAVLLKAGWEKFCHEVWTTIVPEAEAIQRLKARNNLTEEQAIARIRSQPSNRVYVEAANVVFCTLWAKDYTYQQVDRAYKDLLVRM